MYLTKKQDGTYLPTYGSDWTESKRIKVGTEVRVTNARNVGHHRKYFALIRLAHENYRTADVTDTNFRRMIQM